MFRAALCGAALLTLITLHESMHWLVGRAVGLPMFFSGFTSVGSAAPGSPLQNLLSAEVPVAFVFVVGVFANLLVSRERPRWSDWLNRFLIWWAVFGLSYLGFQMSRLSNGDFGSIVYYSHWTSTVRAGIAVAGAVLYLVSGFWVRLPSAEPSSAERRAVQRRSIAPITFAVVSALCIVFLLTKGFVRIASGRASSAENGPVLLIWVMLCAVQVPWTRHRARQLLMGWVFPLALATAALIALSYATELWARRTGFGPAQYGQLSWRVLPPLFSAIWRTVGISQAPQALAHGSGN